MKKAEHGNVVTNSYPFEECARVFINAFLREM